MTKRRGREDVPAGRGPAGAWRRRLRHAAAFMVAALAASIVAAGSVQAAPLRGPHPLPRLMIDLRPARLPASFPVTYGRPAPVALIAPGAPAVLAPILVYHYIRTNPDRRDRLGYDLSVTAGDFGAQMDWLAAAGYHPVTLTALRAFLAGTQALPVHPIVLTFDDGYEDFYTTAYPILAAHHFAAVAYVVAGFVGRPGYLGGDQVRQLDQAGIEIASHTVDHVDLTRVGAMQLAVELSASRSFLEQLVGHPVLDFCYPSSKFNAAVVRAVATSGYQSATTELPGYEHSLPDRLTWTRIRVRGGEGIDEFALSLTGQTFQVPAPARWPPLTRRHH